jgi:hypothetical protein
MTTIQRPCLMMLLSMGLVACGSADDQPRQEPPAAHDDLYRQAVTPMNKARNVESVVMEQKKELDRNLEQNEGGGDQ